MYQAIVTILRPFPLLFLLLLVAVGLLWRRRVESRRRLLLVTAPLGLLALLTLPLSSYLAIGSLEWQYPPRPNRPAGVPALVVLSGGMRQADEYQAKPILYPDSLYRCMHAADLYHQGTACPVFVSGGKVDPTEAGPTLGQMLHDYLVELEVASGDIRIEQKSSNTHENALYTAELLKQEGIKQVVLVTDAVHLPRAVRCFEQQGIAVVPSGCFYRAAGFEWSLRNWLPSAGAAEGVHLAAHEWLGLVYYWLRGWI